MRRQREGEIEQKCISLKRRGNIVREEKSWGCYPKDFGLDRTSLYGDGAETRCVDFVNTEVYYVIIRASSKAKEQNLGEGVKGKNEEKMNGITPTF